ncbi:CotH kinase family protein [Paenibacillus aurantiacus]|uniref:CotH kinase family protein n=1 Tax=Paenibacillus aurantiacus TaxID=1936118 RepID=A0ABV5KRJ5_9BACL
MRAKAAPLLLLVLLLLAMTGCSALGASVPGSSALGGRISADAASADTATSSAEEQKLDTQVFPKDKVVDVKITLDEADFQDMLDNASAEEYKMATVEYNGVKYENVAVRTKGNLSLRSVVNSDSDRYSFKLSFDEYISSQTIEGIRKINLNNNFSDATYMREFLAYELAESMGLPTPKFSYVNVYVNGELKGFYLAVEQIGEAYLDRNFDNAYGALYKANGGAGSELNWLKTLKAYVGLDLKSESANDGVLLEMLDELNNGTNYESALDVENALKFIALNVLSGNMDSYLGQNKHNYYLYENNGIFSVLPWDYNMAFGGFGGSGILIDEPTQGTLADRPLVDKLLKVDAYKTKYHNILARAMEGYLAKDAFAARVAELSQLISAYVKQDPTAFYTYEQYEAAIPELISFNDTQTASIQAQLDGTSPSSGDGSGSGGGMGRGGMGGMGGMLPGAGGANVGQAPEPPGGQSAEAGPGGDVAFDAGALAGPAGGAGGETVTEPNPSGQRTPNGAQTSPNVAQTPSAGQTDSNANGRQQAAQGGVNGQQATGGARTGPNGQAAGNAQGGVNGPQPPGDWPGQNGQGFGGGMRPDGAQGFGGMGGGPGGMGFGPGGQQAAQPEGSVKEAITSGIAVVVLLLACLVVVFYKRKRL